MDNDESYFFVDCLSGEEVQVTWMHCGKRASWWVWGGSGHSCECYFEMYHQPADQVHTFMARVFSDSRGIMLHTNVV